MAGICCGVVGEGETPTPIEPSSRPSARRSLDLLPLKYIADMAIPPLESSRKRQKLDHSASSAAQQPRECENAVENCESGGGSLKEEHIINKESKEKQDAVSLPSSSEISTLKSSETRLEEAEVVEECPKYGVTSVCGRRRDMEDAVSVRPSFCQVKNDTLHFFGVYDGHGCSHVNAQSLCCCVSRGLLICSTQQQQI